MATLVTQQIDLVGLVDPTTVAAAAGLADVLPNDGHTLLYVSNGGGVTLNITIDSKQASSFGSDENITFQLLAGEVGFVGPFDPSRFNNASGQVEIAYDQVATVTVAGYSVLPRGW